MTVATSGLRSVTDKADRCAKPVSRRRCLGSGQPFRGGMIGEHSFPKSIWRRVVSLWTLLLMPSMGSRKAACAYAFGVAQSLPGGNGWW